MAHKEAALSYFSDKSNCSKSVLTVDVPEKIMEGKAVQI